MPWVKYSVEVSREQADAAVDAMLAGGAGSVSITDAGNNPLRETPPGETRLWPRVRVAGLFPDRADPDAIRLNLAAGLGDAGVNVDRVVVEDRDWHRQWLDSLEPMRFGERLWVIPPESPVRVGADARCVFLEPGLAFGTGTHPTTALCLEWLDAHPPSGGTVIDYGCGSGILALAAARLGAGMVWATDHDPQALAATRANASRNRLDNVIRVIPPESIAAAADTICANILLQPLIELADRFAELLRPRGGIVLSGILEHQTGDLVARYRDSFDRLEVSTRDGWARITGSRSN